MAAAVRSGEAVRDGLSELSLGPDFSDEVIETELQAARLSSQRPCDLPDQVADLLVHGLVVLWFQGRMELGPRALGNRSVLARPDRRARRPPSRRVRQGAPRICSIRVSLVP